MITTTRLRTSGFALLGLILTTILLAPGCEDHPCDDDDGNVDPLVGHWILIDELGENREWTYERVEEGKYYDMRFRQQYVFREDGTCRFVVLSPIDAGYWADGTWQRDPSDTTLIHIDSNEGNFSLQIVALTDTRLTIVGKE